MKKLNKAALVGGVAAAAIAATVGVAAPASAYTGNEVAYLNAMENSGFTTYDAPWAISSGYWICNKFSYENGNEIAVDLFRSTSWGDVPNLHVAQTWVNTAANTLCPWVWNAGSVRAIF